MRLRKSLPRRFHLNLGQRFRLLLGGDLDSNRRQRKGFLVRSVDGGDQPTKLDAPIVARHPNRRGLCRSCG